MHPRRDALRQAAFPGPRLCVSRYRFPTRLLLSTNAAHALARAASQTIISSPSRSRFSARPRSMTSTPSPRRGRATTSAPCPSASGATLHRCSPTPTRSLWISWCEAKRRAEVMRIEADHGVTPSQEKCLTFSPRKRITVEQALAHDYLQPYHDPGASFSFPSFCTIRADPRASPLLQRTSRVPSRCRCRASSLTSSR